MRQYLIMAVRLKYRNSAAEGWTSAVSLCVLERKEQRREMGENITKTNVTDMMHKIFESERMGYAYFYPRDGGYRQEFLISTTPENMANFLGSHFYGAEKMVITDICD